MIKNIAFLLLVAIVVTSCKKTDPPKPEPIADWEEVCDSIPPSLSLIGYEWVNDGAQYRQPFIYPSAPHKLLFYKYHNNQETGNVERELIEHNLNTGEQKILLTNRIVNHPQVSRNGDIIFFDYGFQVYMIRNREVKQLTFSGENFFPIWNYDGSVYSYSSQQGNDTPVYYFKNLKGETVDTISYNRFEKIWFGGKADINQNNILCGSGGYKETAGIALINLTKKEYEMLYIHGITEDGRAELNCVKWHPNNQYVYYSDGYGLFRINVATKQKETIAQGCATRRYETFSFTPDGKYIYIQRINYKKESEFVIRQKSRIYRMDADGKNAVRIL